MLEREIFERLFSLIPLSNDTNGVVSACLVRDGEIIAEGLSNNESVHAEYALLQKLKDMKEEIKSFDIVYVTIEPCGKRSPGGRGEVMGDCTTNLIKAGVRTVVFAAPDSHASNETRHKFTKANAVLRQVEDKEITNEAIRLFNATCENPADWLSLE